MRQDRDLLWSKAPLGRSNAASYQGIVIRTEAQRWLDILPFAEREFLQRMVAKQKSRSEIADLMNRHRSTIYRELDRNSTPFGYRPKTAQRMAGEHRAACHRHDKLKNLELCLYVSQRLRKAWSPDQIAGRLRRDFPQTPQR